MQGLFKLLLALPDQGISEQEWDGCLRLVNRLKKANGAAFRRALEKRQQISPLLTNKNITEIAAYLDAWQPFSATLMGWYSILGMTWYQVTHKEMSADDLIPLLAEFLPNETEPLMLLRDKLTKASQVDTHEKGCIITQFYVAVCAKLSPMSDNHADKKHEQLVQTVAERIKQQDSFHQLQLACLHYETYLSEQIEQHIIALNYTKQGILLNGQKHLLKIILEDILNGTCTILTKKREFITLLQKYFILSDIRYSLFKYKSDSETILMEFEKKFEYYLAVSTGEIPNNSLSGWVPSLTLTSAKNSPFSTLAEEIIHLATSVNDDFWPEDKIKSLLSLLSDYEKTIRTDLEALLAPFLYFKKSTLHEANDVIFHELLIDIQAGNAILFSSNELMGLFQRYQAIVTMKQCLQDNHMASFFYLFQQHKDTLALPCALYENKSGASYLGSLSLYSLFPFYAPEGEETTFLKAAAVVLQCIKENTAAPSAAI